MSIHITWHPAKRASNLRDHELDFVDVFLVFDGPTYTVEDDRHRYFEQRFLTIGLLGATPVAIAHTESSHEIHVISFRKATPREARRFFAALQDKLDPASPDEA